jgi:hypothetical protein
MFLYFLILFGVSIFGTPSFGGYVNVVCSQSWEKELPAKYWGISTVEIPKNNSYIHQQLNGSHL